MDYEKFEKGKCRHPTLSSLSRYPCTKLSWPGVLLLYTALVWSFLSICRVTISRNQTEPALQRANAVVQDMHSSRIDYCGGPLSNHELASYDEFARKHENLKIKLLSETDGAPPLQSTLPPCQREITIVSQATVDRFAQLEEIASSWGGAMCVAIHVKTRAQIAAVNRMAKSLHKRIEAQRHCRLHLQMVMEEGFDLERDALTTAYPINALRNVALRMATTDLVFLLDADFIPSPGLHEKLTSNEKTYSDLVRRATVFSQLLVVPAFQASQLNRAADYDDIPSDVPMPQSLDVLRERWLNGSVNYFRSKFPFAHGPTAYGYFLHPLTREPYSVEFTDFYEPYVIGARAIIPQYDERFRGYGRNKMSHLYKCSYMGMSFVVLPKTYVWAINHPKSEYFKEFKLEKQSNPICRSSSMGVLYELFKNELHGLSSSTSYMHL